MNDNKPHKPRPLYSPWPVVILMLFFGAATTLWNTNIVLALIVGAIGVIIFVVWTNIRTKMIREELTLRELFKNWPKG